VENRQRYSVRGSGGFRLAETLSAVGEVEWDRGRAGDGAIARIGIRKRLGNRSAAQLDLDTRGVVRSTYQTAGGRGVGAWSGSVDLNRSTVGSTFNANGSLITNRAELSVNQLATYDSAGTRISDVRTSVRAGTSIAFADGAFAVGRPVQEAFLIASPHRSLKGTPVRLEPQEKSEDASSGGLGNALSGSLTAYSPRLLVYDVPGAPPGYDLGPGNVQLVPAYKAGYSLEIGSDYHLLVVGRLLNHEGQPISLLAGKATDLRAPKRPAVTMFTSRNGKFGAQGLRPGKWRIEMPTEPATVYEIELKDDPSGTVRVGDLRPVEQGDGK
jgi:outer membrane usher protein